MKKNNILKNLRVQLFVAITLFFSSSFFLFIYWPALTGPFLFDDLINLNRLSPGIDSFEKLYAYLRIGDNGLGRPVSFISFLLNDNAWPSESFSFKYTNILIHLLNALLIFIFTLKVLSFNNIQYNQRLLISTLVFFAWLFHPLSASTYLYTVQRMTLLMATFTLIGLIFYLDGRKLFNTNRINGYIVCTVSLVMAGALSVLSKESGITLLIYVIILEFSLLKNFNRQQILSTYWKAIILFLPLFTTIIYIITHWENYSLVYDVRQFTPEKRILTESRILLEYIKEILIPSANGKSILHDDINLSSSLVNPISTIFSVTMLLFIFMSSLILTKKYPWYSFAVLWFLGGHLLESTFIPLELYYEHRNYLPMYGILFGLIYFLTITLSSYTKYVTFAFIIFFSAEIFASYNLSYTWKSLDRLLVTWAQEHPNSVRSQLGVVELLISKRQFSTAEMFFTKAITANPNHLTANLRYVQFTCNRQSSNARLIDLTNNDLLYTHGAYSAIDGIIDNIESNLCHEHLADSLKKLIIKINTIKTFDELSSKKTMLKSYSDKLDRYIKQKNE